MSKKEVQFHDYQYMVNKLRNKGLIIDSNRIAIELLQSVGYYNLINRYKSEFYLPDKKVYRSNVHITDLYYYHRIEDDLRNILFQFAIKFEQRLKESMAYIMAKRRGVKTSEYLNPLTYRNKNKAIKITKFLNKKISECNDDPTKYYKEKYGDVPPWIMLSNITFGQTRMLLSIFPRNMTKYIMIKLLPIGKNNYGDIDEFIFNEFMDSLDLDKYSDKELNQISEKYENTLIKFTRNVISLIHDYRNNLAHGNRLIHFHANTSLELRTLRIFTNNSVFSDEEYYNNQLCSNDLFALMAALVITLDKYDSIYLISQLEVWKKANTATDITKKQFDQFISSSDLPSDFIKRLKNITIEKTNRQKNKEFRDFMDNF
ncbi:Abi family protein [Companilactobacillus nodensis]|uniref:Abi family protein n=1 Tax=Companilactobacillus nodensis TaxID=460870 RepID=UPI00046A8324|nr:Abi family protein [Companilactobacillus nodensis]